MLKVTGKKYVKNNNQKMSECWYQVIALSSDIFFTLCFISVPTDYSQFYHSDLVVLINVLHLSGSARFHRWRNSCQNPHTNQHAWPLVYLFVVQLGRFGFLPKETYRLVLQIIFESKYYNVQASFTLLEHIQA